MGWIRVVSVEGVVKSTTKTEEIKTDTTVFRLNHKLSWWLVSIFTVAYAWVSFDNPISCMTTTIGEHKCHVTEAVNDYCWVHGTYSVSNTDPIRHLYPGIGTVTREEDISYHQYYKWMFFYVFLMLSILTTPLYIWNFIENGMMKQLVQSLDKVIPEKGDKDTVEKEKGLLIDFVISHMGYHRRYAYGFVFCELLNVLVTVAQLYLWDVITSHEFSRHGPPSISVLEVPATRRTDGLAKSFPFLGKCTFSRHGPSGSIEPHEYLCMLPLNLLIERAAVFFWYYFHVVLVITVCSFTFRMCLIFSKRLRIFMLNGLAPLTSLEEISTLSEHCAYSDWFVIYQLGISIEPVIFRLFLRGVIAKLQCICIV